VSEAHTFGRYRVTKALGAGAMGEVFEAVDDVLGREVAIKTLRKNSGALFLDDRFRNEARAIAQLSHPSIVQVFDVDIAASPPYLVMERVPGPSLDERLVDGPLPVDQLLPLGIQIARALAHAHAAGVIHRDVKPANILAAGPAAWKLADFGVAHVPDSSVTMTGQFVGSPAYAPPEALIKGITGAASDVYALGATLYEAAAGKWPRLEANGAPLAPIPPLETLAPHLPSHVCAAIDRAITREHDKRPTASELAELLATDPDRISGSVAARSYRWQPWALGAAVVLAFVGFLATRHGGDRPPPAGAPVAAPENNDDVDIDAELQQIADQANAGDLDGAHDHLDDLEHRIGPDPRLRDLRHQIDKLRKPGHGHGKHGDD
jgi:serine/threonine-protein kinase